MRFLFAAALVCAVLACTRAAAPAVPAPTAPVSAHADIRPATHAEAATIASTQDEFFAALTPSDISVLLHGPGTRDDVARLFAGNVLTWTPGEETRLTAMIARHRAQLDSVARWLPDHVLLVKNTDRIEGGLPHTRANAILWGPSLPASDAELDGVFLHELFHVLSRNNAARHDELYQIVGFTPCTSVTLPAGVGERLITNPDAPLVRWAAPAPSVGEGAFVAPVLLADPPTYRADHAQFMSYFSLRFIALKRDAAGACIPFSASPYVAQPAAIAAIEAAAGHNTDYVLHPEELLADNFEQLMMAKPNVPDPQVQARLAAFLGIEAPARP